MPSTIRRAVAPPRPSQPLHAEPPSSDSIPLHRSGRPCHGASTAAPSWEELLGQR